MKSLTKTGCILTEKWTTRLLCLLLGLATILRPMWKNWVWFSACTLPSLLPTDSVHRATTPQLTKWNPLTPKNGRLPAQHRLQHNLHPRIKNNKKVLCAEARQAKCESEWHTDTQVQGFLVRAYLLDPHKTQLMLHNGTAQQHSGRTIHCSFVSYYYLTVKLKSGNNLIYNIPSTHLTFLLPSNKLTHYSTEWSQTLQFFSALCLCFASNICL